MRGALAAIPKHEIYSRIAAGELPTRIADDIGVDKSAITLRYGKDPDYLRAREVGTEVRLDCGEAAIEAAGDNLNVARAREIVQRRREWRASVEFPHRWGQKSQVTLEVGPDLGEVLMRAQRRVIEGAVVSAPPDAPEDGALEAMDVLSNPDSGG